MRKYASTHTSFIALCSCWSDLGGRFCRVLCCGRLREKTVKQITAALTKAGREFEATEPSRAVKNALVKALVKNNDLFHVRWAGWHLKSRFTPAKYEKVISANETFGTGGKSSKVHSKRTKAGLKAFVAKGGKLGAKKILTPELLERANVLIREPGAKMGEIAKTLGVATSSLYAHGFSTRAHKQKRDQAKTESLFDIDSSTDAVKLRVVK